MGVRYTPPDIYFKDTAEGRAFYPFGAAGRGRLVTPAKEATIRRVFTVYKRIGIGIVVAGVLLWLLSLGKGTTAVVLLTLGLRGVAFVICAIVVAARLADMPTVSERLTGREILAAQGRGWVFPVLVGVLLVGGVFLMLFGGAAAVGGHARSLPSAVVIGLGVMVAGFGLLCVAARMALPYRV